MKLFLFSAFCLLLSLTFSTQLIESKKVKVSVYYETICTACRKHFLGVVVPARKAIGDYMDLELVPYGNARMYPQVHRIYCQHGDSECYGNACQACALDIYGFEKLYEYTICMFESPHFANPAVSAKECAQSLQMDFQKIHSCASGDRGWELALEMRSKTDSVPDREYVPWTTVEGKYVDFHANLIEYICENFLADENVPACQKNIY
ncbi:gilt-like protein [Dermatophagoides farinae]|nr:gilt-like protein [Dermatophagoides farinae]